MICLCFTIQTFGRQFSLKIKTRVFSPRPLFISVPRKREITSSWVTTINVVAVAIKRHHWRLIKPKVVSCQSSSSSLSSLSSSSLSSSASLTSFMRSSPLRRNDCRCLNHHSLWESTFTGCDESFRSWHQKWSIRGTARFSQAKWGAISSRWQHWSRIKS